ncbi:hypothetical protein [Hyunsoonleella ulvae]|uniref:hypothetical protein n=1 Tax=Hyunsoonleella ulvae TaxID=2799948 RepID=UPI001939A18B|nr:hypothetical protein [Hyunsoonleella ulvae]
MTNYFSFILLFFLISCTDVEKAKTSEDIIEAENTEKLENLKMEIEMQSIDRAEKIDSLIFEIEKFNQMTKETIKNSNDSISKSKLK